MDTGSEAGTNTRDGGALRYRVATAAVGLPVVLTAVWAGGIPLYLLASVAAAAGAFELGRLLLAPRGPLLYVSIALAAALPAAAFFLELPMWPHLAIGGIAAGLLAHRVLTRREGTGTAARLVGPLYPAALLSFGVALHDVAAAGAAGIGARWLLAALLLVFVSDTSAYFAGRLLGSRRLAPRISPKKTWEGAVGAVAAASVTCVLLPMVLPLRGGETVDPSAFGVLAAFGAGGAGISILSQVGDLFVSAVKRAGGAKESSGLLPGHGGFLDRLDSVLPVLPAVYYGLQWVS